MAKLRLNQGQAYNNNNNNNTVIISLSHLPQFQCLMTLSVVSRLGTGKMIMSDLFNHNSAANSHTNNNYMLR